jgi:hypothetical protein
VLTFGGGCPGKFAKRYRETPVIQKDAFERLGLKQMLLERAAMPDKTKDTARQVVAKVVKEVMEKLESKTVEAIRGSLKASCPDLS